MGEGIAGLLTAPWAPAVAAFLFGIATGWLIWGGRRSNGAPASDSAAGAAKDACPEPMKIGAVESEIKSARALIEETDAEAKALAAELSSLDSAIKRANGRLKLVLIAIKKAGRR